MNCHNMMMKKITAHWFDTKTRAKCDIALSPSPLRVYSCGPTVYSTATLGNHRANVTYDLVRRGLEWLGYDVKWVMNYTDVGHLVADSDDGADKMALAAKKERLTAWQVAERVITSIEHDLDALHITRPTQTLRATDHIAEMIHLISELEERGYTYQTSDGVYFDSTKFASYGELAGLDIKGQREGARVEKNPEKRHPTDFALWKFSPKDEQRDMEWESPWGKGFPGWHIECSAMSMLVLGPTIDLHLGGIDLLQPHHTNEVAQSEAATGKPFVKHWMHIEHLLIDGRRMGKSENNAYTLDDIESKGFSALDFRYLCMLTHYRKKLNFTWESLAAAARARRRLQPFLTAGTTTAKADEAVLLSLKERVADDLDLPSVLAQLWEYLGGDADLPTKQATLAEVNTALLDLADSVEDAVINVPEKIQTLIGQRDTARAERDFAAADTLREQIESLGYMVEDTPHGAVVRLKI